MTLAFAYNMFDNERTKKFRRNYDQDDHEDQMGKMFERKTNFFVDVALQAAEYEQIQRPETVTTRRTRTNTEVERRSFDETAHEKIRAAYQRSKSTYK